MRTRVHSVQRRILVPFLLLITTVLVALVVPLGYARTLAAYHRFAIGQLIDCEHLAWIASGVGNGGSTFQYPPDPQRVLAQFELAADGGETIMLVDRQQKVLLANRSTAGDSLDGRVSDRVARALKGFANNDNTARVGQLARAEPFVAAHPVRDSHSVVGAVVLIAPTGQLRTSAGLWLLPLIAVMVAAMLTAIGIAVPLSRWMLQPILDLIGSARAFADGDYNRRVFADSGPREVRELSSAFNTMADRVRTALAVQRTFVSDASHQLRNPLTALRMRVEALAPFVQPSHQDKLQHAVTEVQYLSQVLDQLLELARAEGRKLPMRPQATRPVIAGRLQAWSEVARRRSVTFSASGQDAWVLAPSEVLDQVLDVLLDNALRSTPVGTTVAIRVSARGQRIVIEVADEGAGMTDEEKDRATDRFWRGSHQGGHRGSGLGLAIAASLVASADGQFSLHDGQPRGLVARIELAGAPSGAEEQQPP